jgi:hypothetical protein
MNQAAAFFASVVDLARDSGAIGQVLRHYDGSILQAADEAAKRAADSRQSNGDPDRLPLPDPWEILLELPGVPEFDKAIFQAARSQLLALRHLGRIRLGIATQNTDWQRTAIQARRAGDVASSNHAAEKVANNLWQYEPVTGLLHEQATSRPGLLQNAEDWQSKRKAQMVHHGEWVESEKNM